MPIETQWLMLLMLITLIGLIGVIAIIGLMTTWRRSQHRLNKQRPNDKSNTEDAWAEAGQRMLAGEGDSTDGTLPGDDAADSANFDQEPPTFDTGLDDADYQDPYQDEGKDIDTGDEWKQGTDYEDDDEDLFDDEQTP